MKPNTFYGNDECTYYVNSKGLIYEIQSPDLQGDQVYECDDLPFDVVELSDAICRDLDVDDLEG